MKKAQASGGHVQPNNNSAQGKIATAAGKSSSIRILPNNGPSPRLLHTVVPELSDSPAPAPAGRSVLKSSTLFGGNGISIFIGILAGAAVLCGVGYLYGHHYPGRKTAGAAKLLSVVTRSISSSPHAVIPPAPLIVQISPSHISVSAISLGLPRLAIINGQQVTEGDTLTLHTPTASVEVHLRIVKIADGRVDLSDGMQIISARVALPEPKHGKAEQ